MVGLKGEKNLLTRL